MLYMATHFLALAGLAGLFYLTGWLLDQRVFQGRGMEPISGVARFGLGSAIWMGWVFVLAASQVLTASALGLGALLTLLVAWRVRRGTSRVSLGDAGRFTGWARDPVAWILGGLVTFLLAGLWLQAIWPVLSWDADVYHLTIPRIYLDQGGFRRVPFNVYSNWPLNTQMIYALALAAKDHVLAKSVHFAFGVATLAAIWRTVRSESRSWVAWLAGALFLVNPVVLDEFRAAYVDLAFAFFLFLGFLMLHQALESTEYRDRRMVLAGVFGGVAAGIKPTGIVGVLCLGALFAIVTLRRKQSLGHLGRGLLQMVIPAGLLLVPWVLKTWILTENPLYPFLYSWFGGPEWSVSLGDQLGQWQRGIGMGRGWLDYLLLPIRVVVSGGSGYNHFDGRISILWLALVPLATALSRGRPLIARSLGVSAIYFILWAVSSQQMRFLIPVLPFLAMAGALALFEVSRNLQGSGRTILKWTVSLGLVLTLVLVSKSMIGPTRSLVAQYLDQGAQITESAVHPVFRFIDEQTPVDAKLMLLNTNRGFFCHREYIADSFFEASQINDRLQRADGVSGLAATLEELGVTHLLIENRDRSVPWPKSLYEFLNDSTRARKIYRSPDKVYDVVEVLSPAVVGN